MKNVPSPNFLMSILLPVALLSSVSAHAAGSVRHAPRPTERPAPAGSFTSERVESFDELKSQVRRDPAVRRRYARFFHMPESAVPGFVSTGLYPVQLTRPWAGRVYYVSARGEFRSHAIRLRPGSRVFALRSSGQPALNFVCGNTFLIPIKNRSVPVTDHPPAAFAFGLDTPTDALGETAFPPELVSLSPDATPVLTLVSPSPPTALSRGSRFLPLVALGLLGVHTGHDSTPPVAVPAVPETGAAVLLLAGMPLLGVVARRRMGRQ